MDDHLDLVADISTLRVASWLKNEAFAMADVVNAPYNPRQVLKQALSESSFKSA
jgi:glutamine synthetase